MRENRNAIPEPQNVRARGGLFGSGRSRERILRPCWLVGFVVLLLAATFGSAAAQNLLESRQIAPGVHVFVGDLGPQTFANGGLNANLGFVVGADAVLVINTGPSRRIGEALLQEIRRTTDKPVRWVVNLNSQNHYWWGNSAFAAGKQCLLPIRRQFRRCTSRWTTNALC